MESVPPIVIGSWNGHCFHDMNHSFTSYLRVSENTRALIPGILHSFQHRQQHKVLHGTWVFFPQIFVLDRTFLTLFEISWDYTWSAKAKGILTRSWQESAGISIVSPDRISLVWIKGRNINILRIWTNKCWRPRNKNGDSPVCAKHVVYFKRGNSRWFAKRV